MTRAAWKALYRLRRLNKTKTTISYVDMYKVLTELYAYRYTDKQIATMTLCSRYKTKVTKDYQSLIESWKPEAKERAKKSMHDLVYTTNPLLALIKK